MRRPFAVLALALALSACQKGPVDETSAKASDPAAAGVDTERPPQASTGAGGAVTGMGDPNPGGAGATTDATPNDPTGALGSTAPTSPAPSPPPQ